MNSYLARHSLFAKKLPFSLKLTHLFLESSNKMLGKKHRIQALFSKITTAEVTCSKN